MYYFHPIDPGSLTHLKCCNLYEYNQLRKLQISETIITSRHSIFMALFKSVNPAFHSFTAATFAVSIRARELGFINHMIVSTIDYITFPQLMHRIIVKDHL